MPPNLIVHDDVAAHAQAAFFVNVAGHELARIPLYAQFAKWEVSFLQCVV
jgi:hypothetical protein